MNRNTLPGACLILLAIVVSVPALSQDRPILELSLADAVERAMENNLDIAVERYNPEASEEQIREAEGFYDFTFTGNLSQGSRTTPQSNAFTGGESVDTDTTIWNFGGFQALKTGASLQADFRNQRQDTDNIFSSFNPSYQSSFFLSLSQPLFRDFKIDRARYNLRVAKTNREISDAAFRQAVINTLANTKTLYFDLLAAIDNLEAQRKSLALAEKLLEENEIKVRVGTLAPLDVVEAQSEVASRSENVIVAENQLAEAEDALKLAIFPGHDAATWSLRIVPTDRPTTEKVEVNTEAAVERALEVRTDVVNARKRLQNSELTLDFAQNQTKPTIDLQAQYGSVGVGGTFLIRDEFGGPIIDTIPGGYGDAVSDVFGLENPDWSVGVQISVPLQNRTAKAQRARSQIALDQARTSLKRLEMLVAQAVRTSARAVNTNYERVQSTKAARVLSERRLDAEQKKFAAGMSTSFLVTQAQRDLALAEVSELRAAADYRKSIVDFERVQEAGIGTGTGSISVTSVGLNTSVPNLR